MGLNETAAPSGFLARFAAFAALTVGLFVLVGWTLGLEQLTNIVPDWPRMPLMTAANFLLAGIALWLTIAGAARSALGIASLVVLIGLAVLIRDAGGWDAHLEQFSLGAMRGDGAGLPAVRMATASALAFVFLGSSIALSMPRRTVLLHQALAIGALLLGWVGFTRYVFGGDALFALVDMPVHTALLLIALSGGVLALRTDRGLAALLASDGVGGAMARRLLPAAVLVPLIAGAFTVRYHRGNVLSFEDAVAVFALFSVVVFVAFVWINAARGERADLRRRDAERALRISEERYQLNFETALDAIVMIDRHGIVAAWNNHAEKIFGWPRGEALGRELAELVIPPDKRDAHRAGLARYVQSGLSRLLNRRIEISALHRDGHEFPVELAITPIGFGDELVFTAFIRDITSRVRAEAALRESEQRFRNTANAAPVLIWMSGTDRRRTWFNQRWLDFVGRSMEQEWGDGWCDNLHPADFDRVLDTHQAAFESRRPYEMEFRLQREDGAWRWLLERGSPISNADGEFEGFIGTDIDITEHRETVEALRESRARFKTLAESLPQMIWTCTRDGYCDYLSRQWLDYTGRSESQQLGKGWLEQVHPDDRVKVNAEWSRVVGSGDNFDLTFRIRRFDGVYRWFQTRGVPQRDPAGRILKWFGSNTDIEESVMATAQLNRQIERMQLLDRTTHAIGAHQEVRKVFEVVLRSLEDNLGVDLACICHYQTEPHQLLVASVGQNCVDLARELGIVERGVIAVDNEALERCVRGELVFENSPETSTMDCFLKLARGGLRSMVFAPLEVEDEVVGIMFVAARNPQALGADDREFLRQLSSHLALATRQARLFDALQSAYQDLRQTQQTVMQQERLRALGQIASGIAHDINNALSPAALYTQSLLSHDQSLSPRAREHLVVIQRAIDDIAQTVQRMRAFYMPRGQELTLAPLDLNTVAAQVVDLTRARWHNMAQERGIVVRVGTEFAADLPPVLGSEGEVRDALTNLILNAVDALPEGGSITLRTRFDPRDRQVVLEVQDDGVGMNETARSRCLEPFFTTKGERGTGLGLTMVFGMMQRHGGELEIDSELGKGTTVRLTFPSAPTGVSMRDAIEPPTPGPLRILLVDDDPLVLRSLRDALEFEQHVVITAEGGQAGLDEFAAALEGNRPFDIVITDLGMPYVDGRKVAARVRQLDAKVPIIMLTGWGHRLIATDDRPEHVDRVLSKPPKMVELRNALNELTRARG